MRALTAADVAGAHLPEAPFATSRRPAYAVEAVDARLDACRAALEAWERGEPATLKAADVVAAGLPKGAGYSADAVDDLLDRIAVQLSIYERDGTGAPGASSKSTGSAAAVEPVRSYELTTARIPQRRVGGRYAIDEVDIFVGEISTALSNVERGKPAGLHSDDIVHKEFKAVSLLGLGYDADAVDDLLDRAVIQLRHSEPKNRLQVEQEQREEAQLRGMLDDIRNKYGRNGDR
ncbi:DivIVA domain-containing protein [Microbacterium bovistercoris]|uniref:DivIVA domain-containing protein n=1 Tax=Microbacterium bovistercoris TaxID=2293570 RepID=A0A371NPK7_9MICO|nr:DivIVA domain-containing protein [Microbacterium bovistercoris]REJ04113.1 DivIVA domain-containing protein [Microbacterium bovistercoris]